MKSQVKSQICNKAVEMKSVSLFPFEQHGKYNSDHVWEYKAVLKSLLRSQPDNDFFKFELDMVDEWLTIYTVDEDNEDFISTERAAIWRKYKS